MKKLILVLKRDVDLDAFLSQLKLTDIQEFRVEDLEEGLPPAPRVKRLGQYKPRTITPSGKPAWQHLQEKFGIGKHFWLKEVRDLMTSLGYSDNTASSILSTLKMNGYAGRRDTDGMWYLLKTIPPGAKFNQRKEA